ncbi:hypothetical protein HD554DRAFT_375787 [Boletus coccyginus]|nr:hypothetical protein HD554DRAFT_375787 [Boletus coccyginus]
MKLTFKIYQQADADFEIDADPSETIGDVKEKVNASQGHDVEKQNFIFRGKGLANDQTIESCKITEQDYVVLLISKPRPPLPVTKLLSAEEYYALGEPEDFLSTLSTIPSAGLETTSTFKYVPMSSSASDPTSAPTETTSASTFKYVPMSSSGSRPASTSESSPATTSASTFKYVPMSSSPRVPASRTTPGSTITQQQQGGPLGGVPGAGLGSLGGPASPGNIAQFRELIARNPALRQEFIRRLSEDNPALAQVLIENPEVLTQLLDGIGEDEDAVPSTPPVRLDVTEAERHALERLEALGFPRQAVVEAYFACDKNEQLAANYLLEKA